MGIVVASLCMLGASASHEAATAHDMTFHWALFIVSMVVAVLLRRPSVTSAQGLRPPPP